MSSLNTSEIQKPFLKINDNSSYSALSEPDTTHQLLSDLDSPPSNTPYIKRYQNQSLLYGITFQSSPSPLTLALSTKNISLKNKITIIEFSPQEDKFIERSNSECEFPPSSILFCPSQSNKDLLISTSDSLRIYKYSENKLTFQKEIKGNNKIYCGPLTSCDWSHINPSIVGVSSSDTTCKLWDITKLEILNTLIVDDKSVYDINFGNDDFTFMTAGASGGIRLFDIRTPDTCKVLFNNGDPVSRVKGNLINGNLVICCFLDKSIIYVLDKRKPDIPYAILEGHTNVVNNAIWAPKSNTNVISVGDDKMGLVWDVYSDYMPKCVMEYKANKEIENVSWGDATDDWVGIIYGNNVEILKMK